MLYRLNEIKEKINSFKKLKEEMITRKEIRVRNKMKLSEPRKD